MNSSRSIEAQIARLMWAFDASTQTELADALGIRQATVSEGIKKGAIPARWLLGAVEKADIRPQWIRTGEGPVTYGDGAESQPGKMTSEAVQGRRNALSEFSTAALVEELRRRATENP